MVILIDRIDYYVLEAVHESLMNWKFDADSLNDDNTHKWFNHLQHQKITLVNDSIYYYWLSGDFLGSNEFIVEGALE